MSDIPEQLQDQIDAISRTNRVLGMSTYQECLWRTLTKIDRLELDLREAREFIHSLPSKILRYIDDVKIEPVDSFRSATGVFVRFSTYSCTGRRDIDRLHLFFYGNGWGGTERLQPGGLREWVHVHDDYRFGVIVGR